MEEFIVKVPAIFRQFIDDGGSEKKTNVENLKEISNLDNITGLSDKEADRLLKKYGENSLISQKNVSAMKIFAGQFKDLLVLVLLSSTIISIFMGEITEAIVITIILFLNACMGFFQEFKTEKTLEALDNMVNPNVKVLRNGQEIEKPANLLVKHDIIFLEMGDCVPADCVILKSNRFEVDESMLTGESVAVVKEAISSVNEIDYNNLDKTNLIYMGTSVIKGTATAKIIKTGMKTQMGKIASLISEVQKEQTPIQKRLTQMGAIIVTGCLIAASIVVLIGILRGEQPFDMIVTGLSLAVASVPEGLPAIVTIALSFAVKRMVKKKALIRKLHAVETLGCANLICTDKTGTITQNKMTLKKIVLAQNEFEIKNDDKLIKNENLILDAKSELDKNRVLEQIIYNFIICNSAKFSQTENKFMGEPTETALLIAASKFKVNRENLLESRFEIYDEIPFDSGKKFMMVFVKLKNEENKKFVFVKGAYDVVLKMCSKCYIDNDKFLPVSNVKDFFDNKNMNLAKKGMRILAFASGVVPLNENDVFSNLNFLGLAAMIDPPRKEAKKAVLTCKRAGIKTVMITGDQKLTATAIAKQVGIYRRGDLSVEGKELDKLSELELKNLIKKTTIFARVSPEHKFRIVKAFKQTGHIVAMTGDGVNDAPAIKEANIGVAMGGNGSDVAKQAADLVLLDDNFATLVTAIEEGRIIYGNMRKFIRYLLSCNFGEVLTSLFAMIIGMPVPLLPMQILLINLVTDGLPAIALGLEPAEEGIMEHSPRNIKETIFSGGLVSKILVRGFLIAITTLTVFTIIFKTTFSIQIARTATFLTLISSQLVHVFECKSEKKSIFKLNYLNNKKLLLAVTISLTLAIISIWFQPLSKILKNYPLSIKQILTVAFATLVVPFVNGINMEIRKFIKKRKERLTIIN